MKKSNNKSDYSIHLSKSYCEQTHKIINEKDNNTVELLRKICCALAELDETIASTRILQEELEKLDSYVEQLTSKQSSFNTQYLEDTTTQRLLVGRTEISKCKLGYLKQQNRKQELDLISVQKEFRALQEKVKDNSENQMKL